MPGAERSRIGGFPSPCEIRGVGSRHVIRFGFDLDIDRPVSEVFAFITDPARLPEWQTNTVEAHADPPGPLRPGSRIREVHTSPFGKTIEEDVEVAACEPGRLLELHIVDGLLPIDGRWEFERLDGGTRLHFSARGEPNGPWRLAEPLLKLGIRQQMREHHRRLKERLERP